jgi:hypothetical protein
MIKMYLDRGFKFEIDVLKGRRWLGKEYSGKNPHSYFLRPHCTTFEV